MSNVQIPTHTPPNPQIILTNEQRQTWFSLLLVITKIELGLTASGMPVWLALYFFSGQTVVLLAMALLLVNLLLGVVRLVMLRGKLSRWLEVATAEAVIGHLLVISLATAYVGISSGIVSMFFWAPVLVSILGLARRIIAATTLATMLVLVVGLLLQDFNIVKPALDVTRDLPAANIFLWVISLVLIVVGLLVFADRLRMALGEARRRATETEESNRKLSEITLVGSELSQLASSVSNELTATSNQQASGAAQQSEAVVAATTSLEELGQSASQIADNAQNVAAAVAGALNLVREVNEISEQAEEIAGHGQNAVTDAIHGIERVSQRIEALAQHLLVLTERSKQIGAIIDLLDGIADETHLLALNAAIESAGAGEFGQRFGVVASEVKNLADRSVESTKEVREIISELQGAVAAAVLTAEEGRKEAARATDKAYQAQQVIEQVNHVVVNTNRQGSRIVKHAENASLLAEEIKLATSQQRSASSQIVFIIRQVKEVAHETATSSRHVAASAQQLSELTFQLARTLKLKDLKATEKSEVNVISTNGYH